MMDINILKILSSKYNITLCVHIRLVYLYLMYFFASNYGISSLVEMEWNRLNIPNVLRIFWSIRVLEEILYMLTDMETKNETMYGAIKYLLIKGCDTFTAVLGMTSFVSYFCHYIGAFFQWVKCIILI